MGSIITCLIPGLSGATFHGLLRLSYGLSLLTLSEGSNANSKKFIEIAKCEIVAGLAYMADSYLPLPSASKQEKLPIEQAIKLLEDTTSNHQKYDFSNEKTIFARIYKTTKTVAYCSAAAEVHYDDKSIQQLSSYLLKWYATHENFSLLHTVTASEAFITISPYIEDKSSAFNYLWKALVATILTTNIDLTSIEIPEVSAGHLPDWGLIKQTACNSLDDHVIKLTNTAWEKWKTSQETLYQFIAARKCGLIQM